MTVRGLLGRAVGLSLLCALGACGSGATALAPGGTQVDDQPDLDPADAGTGGAPEEFVALNGGGGDLADRLGGATYTGQATGPFTSGSLTLTFSPDGVLTSLGGTVVASFFGFPSGSEVIFDYQTPAVTGTYHVEGAPDRSLASFLADTAQSVELRSVTVILVGDSLSVLTDYAANLAGHPAGRRTIALEGTVRFETNEDIQGALVFPDYTDTEVPGFTLDRS